MSCSMDEIAPMPWQLHTKLEKLVLTRSLLTDVMVAMLSNVEILSPLTTHVMLTRASLIRRCYHTIWDHCKGNMIDIVASKRSEMTSNDLKTMENLFHTLDKQFSDDGVLL